MEFGSRRPPLQPELAGCKTRQKEGGGEDNKEQEKEEKKEKEKKKNKGTREQGEEQEGVAPVLTSRDPHLAGLLEKP